MFFNATTLFTDSDICEENHEVSRIFSTLSKFQCAKQRWSHQYQINTETYITVISVLQMSKVNSLSLLNSSQWKSRIELKHFHKCLKWANQLFDDDWGNEKFFKWNYSCENNSIFSVKEGRNFKSDMGEQHNCQWTTFGLSLFATKVSQVRHSQFLYQRHPGTVYIECPEQNIVDASSSFLKTDNIKYVCFNFQISLLDFDTFFFHY